MDIFQGGFVCGELILFNAVVDNRSNKSVTMSTRLIQNLRFHTRSKTKSCKRVIGETTYPGRVEPRTNVTWKGALIIPPVCQSSNASCRIIEITYTIDFNFSSNGVSISTDLLVPITIGTIPLRSVEAMSDDMNASNLPPSYEACMFGPNPNQMPPDYEDKREIIESDDASFRPMYPYYKDYSN